jgi:hypothetical protein
VVPGAGSLTVSPNDPVAAGAWGQRSGGPANPQQLNRYSYVLNNPVGNVDPSGHCFGPVLVWCAAVIGEFVADVVVPAVIGTFIIAGAADVGQQLGQAHAAESKGDDSVIYGTGNSKSQGPKARPGDVTLDDNGNVVPGEGGASGAETPDKLRTRGYVYRKQVDPNDPDIEYRPDGGQPDGRGGEQPDGHVSAVPRQSMPFEQYNESHRRGWEPVKHPETGEHLVGPHGK